MTIAIEFDTIEARDAFAQVTPPEGVSFYIEAANEGGVIAATFTLFAEVTRDVSIALFSHWLYDEIKQHPAKSIRINGKEPVDRAEFERIIASDLEIGKND